MDDGGYAFPCKESHWEPSTNRTEKREFPGMTLRDWFAGQALAGVVVVCAGDHRRIGQSIEDYFAAKAYSVADAMLTARKKGPSDD